MSCNFNPTYICPLDPRTGLAVAPSLPGEACLATSNATPVVLVRQATPACLIPRPIRCLGRRIAFYFCELGTHENLWIRTLQTFRVRRPRLWEVYLVCQPSQFAEVDRICHRHCGLPFAGVHALRLDNLRGRPWMDHCAVSDLVEGVPARWIRIVGGVPGDGAYIKSRSLRCDDAFW